VVDYVYGLSKELRSNEGVLVEKRIYYKPLKVESRILDCCFRILLARGCDDNGVTTGVWIIASWIHLVDHLVQTFGRFGPSGGPIAISCGGFYETVEYFATLAGMSDEQYLGR
jgi:hypothetical protein